MIGASGAMLIVVFLFGLLGILALRSALSSRDEARGIGGEESLDETCPSEFVARLFSYEDEKFVEGLHAPEVLKMLRRERRRLAIQWIEQTRAHIRRIMREHKAAARQADDLSVRTELSLVGQHIQIVLICQMLAASIQVVDPPRLRDLAVHADLLFQRLAQAQRSLDAALRGRETMRNTGPA